MSRRRKRSWVRMTAVKPATNVPSRSKNAPTFGPGGLARISATEPGNRKSGSGFRAGGSFVLSSAALMSPTPIETADQSGGQQTMPAPHVAPDHRPAREFRQNLLGDIGRKARHFALTPGRSEP